MAPRPVKLRLLPRTTVKAKCVTALPVRIVGGDGILASKANGIWNISVDADSIPSIVGLVIGVDVQAYDADLTALSVNATSGLWAVTGPGTGAARTLTGPAVGVTVTNGNGVAGDPTIALANDLLAVEGLSGTGIARRTSTDNWSVGTLVSYAEIQNVGASSLVGNNAGAPASAVNITLGATLAFSGVALQTAAHTGDVTSSANSFGMTIANAAVTFAKFQNIAASSLFGNNAGAPGAGTNISLGATLAFSGAALQTAAHTGDVTSSANSFALTIPNDTVTYAKMQNVSATSRILGRKTASAGDPEECTLSEILDFIGSAAQGDILYRGSSGWARLGAGTSGDFLKTNGAAANPAWATASGSAVAATQAEQEAASSTTVFVTPGRQQYHPSAAKAWAHWNAAATVSASYGLSSIGDNGAGNWTVNFATNFSSANFGITGAIGYVSGACVAFTIGPTAASSSQIFGISSAGTLVDPTASDHISAAFHGDQ